jgi:hypothetical protein
MPKQDRYWKYFDEAWKKIIERLFPYLLEFFVPELYNDVDFSNKPFFLDKEMEQLSKESVKGAKYVDKLAKIYLKDGSEQWILVHIEVQGYPDENFPLRMFRYFYRIFDKHGKQIVSVALMTDSDKSNPASKYELKAYGSGVSFDYLSFRLIDYDRTQLENSDNPIATIILTCQDKEIAKQKGKAFDIKRNLIRNLFSKGFNKDIILASLEFIDWTIVLDEEDENILLQELKQAEEVKRMPYVMSFERIARKEGRKKGIKEGRKEGLKEGEEKGLKEGKEEGLLQGSLLTLREVVLETLGDKFGEIPPDLPDIVNQIDDKDKLKELNRLAIKCASIEEYKNMLHEKV